MTTAEIKDTSLGSQESSGFSRQLRRPVLTGYWHNWHTESASFLPLRDVPSAFDVVNVAFAVTDTRHNGSLVFEPCNRINPRQLKAEIATLQSSGRKVLISVGGANGSVALEDLAARRNFSKSLDAILYEYGFNGVDINLEGTIHLEKGDDDLTSPSSPSVIHLIEALRNLKTRFGSNLMISLAPQVACVQGGFSLYRGFQGAYLPVIEHLRDILDFVHVQYYNADPQKALNGQIYAPNDPDFHVAMAEMLLSGFPVADRSNHFFSGLNPGQISAGLSASKTVVQNGFLAPQQLEELFARLTGKIPPAGRYKLQNQSGYADTGNLMTWSINWDAAGGGIFSSFARKSLDSLRR